MPKICSICTYPQREQIDIEIVNGTSVRDIAARFSVSRSSVGRHRVNCHKAIIASTLESSKAAELLEAVKQAAGSEVGVTSLTRADEMFRRSRKAVIEAFKSKDYRIAFIGLREARGYLELIAKLTGESDRAERPREYGPMFVFQGSCGIDFGGRLAVTANQQRNRLEGRNVTPTEPIETTREASPEPGEDE